MNFSNGIKPISNITKLNLSYCSSDFVLKPMCRWALELHNCDFDCDFLNTDRNHYLCFKCIHVSNRNIMKVKT